MHKHITSRHTVPIWFPGCVLSLTLSSKRVKDLPLVLLPGSSILEQETFVNLLFLVWTCSTSTGSACRDHILTSIIVFFFCFSCLTIISSFSEILLTQKQLWLFSRDNECLYSALQHLAGRKVSLT